MPFRSVRSAASFFFRPAGQKPIFDDSNLQNSPANFRGAFFRIIRPRQNFGPFPKSHTVSLPKKTSTATRERTSAGYRRLAQGVLRRLINKRHPARRADGFDGMQAGICEMFQSMKWTHNSIRELLRLEVHPSSVDALALVGGAITIAPVGSRRSGRKRWPSKQRRSFSAKPVSGEATENSKRP